MPYDYSADGATDFDLVPEGTHEFFIDSITEKYSKKGRHMVEICLKPSDISLQKFGKVWHYIMLDNEFANINVGRLLAAIGRDPGSSGSIEFSDFKGEYLNASIKHQEDDIYGSKASVKRLLSRHGKEESATHPTNAEADRLRVRGEEKSTAITRDEYMGSDPILYDIPF